MYLGLFGIGSDAGKVSADRLIQPAVRRAFRAVRVWAFVYLMASAIALIAAFLVPHGADGGSFIGTWVRCAVVALVAAVINVLAVAAQRGGRRSYGILRVFVWLESLGCVLVVLIVPNYPLWLRLATVVIGVFAVGTAVATSNHHLRGAFANQPA